MRRGREKNKFLTKESLDNFFINRSKVD